MTKFSLVIPSARPWSTLKKTLVSLQQQNYAPQKFEVLVVRNNANSSIRSGKTKTFPFRLQVFETKLNGPAAARNFGVSRAQYNTIIFLDDDCAVSADFLEKYAVAWSKFPKATIIGGPVRATAQAISASAQTLIQQHPWCFAQLDWGKKLRWLQLEETLMSANLSFDRRRIPLALDGNYFYEQLGRKFTSTVLVNGEDWELCLRVHRSGGRIAYAAKALVENEVEKARFSFNYLWRRYWMAGKERSIVEQHLAALFPQNPLQPLWKESLFSWEGGFFRLVQLLSYGLSRARAVLYNPPWV